MNRAAWLLVCTAACGRLSFDGVTTSDASIVMGDAAKLAPPCASTTLFADDFDDGTPGPLFRCDSDPGVTCAETGGHFEVVFTPPIAMFDFAFYVTQSLYPVAGLCVTAEISVLPNDNGAVFYKVSGPRQLEYVIARSFVQMRTQTNNVVDPDSYTQLDPDPTWRYWRLRSQGGNGYWDVSSDAVTYYELREEPGIFATITNITIVAGAGTIRDSSAADTMRYERIEATGP